MKRTQILVIAALFFGSLILAQKDGLNSKYFSASKVSYLKEHAKTWTPYEIDENPLYQRYTDSQISHMLGGLRRPLQGSMLEYLYRPSKAFNKLLPFLSHKDDEEIQVVKKSDKPRLKSIPSSFDARAQWPSCIHSVRDQGGCGSCYAYSTAGFFEDRLCIASSGAITERMSPQEIISCDFTNGGCNGGWLTNGLNYLIEEGILTDSCMAETSNANSMTNYCKFQCDDASTEYKKYYCKRGSLRLFTTTEDIQEDLMTNGPMQVGFVVYDDFLDYSSGVYQYTSGSLAGGHAVKLIGWDTDGSGKLYWIAQNQWGTSWGLSGYFYIYEGQVGFDSIGFACEPDI